jgi:HEAT repeat protein
LLAGGVLLFCCVRSLWAAEPAVYGSRTTAQWMQVLSLHLDQNTDQGKESCRRAAAALGQIGPEAAAAVPLLIQALQSPSPEVRQFAVDALGRIGPEARQAVAPIVAEVDLPPGHVNYAALAGFRRLAARALGRIGPEAQPAVPVLEKALQNEDAVYRVEAALALWRIGRHPRAIEVLTVLVAKNDPVGPYEAAMALGELGAAAEPALPDLVAALNHSQADVRRAAGDVLVRLGRPALEPVAQRMQQAPLAAPQTAAFVLGRTIAEVRREIFDKPAPDPAVFGAATMTVVRQAAPPLVTLLADPREEVRQAAGQALAEMGLLAVPLLLAPLGGGDATAREAAIETLIRIEDRLPPGERVSPPLAAFKSRLVAPLVERMSHPQAAVRAAAFRIFAQLAFGQEGNVAIPVLRKALRDENLAVRKYASQALRDLENAGAGPPGLSPEAGGG